MQPVPPTVESRFSRQLRQLDELCSELSLDHRGSGHIKEELGILQRLISKLQHLLAPDNTTDTHDEFSEECEAFILEEMQRMARVGYLEWTAANNILAVSSELRRMIRVNENLRLSLEDLLMLIQADDRDQLRTVFTKATTLPMEFDATAALVRQEEEKRVLHFRGISRADSSGNISRMYCMVRDITKEINTETELRELNQMLERRVMERTRELEVMNAELESFAYVVSHDLKAPLRAIASISDWIIQDHGKNLGQEGVKQLQLLKSRVNRMNNMIHGILTYSKITRPESSVDELVNVQSLVEEVFDTLNVDEKASLVTSEPLPHIKFNRTLLGQVFENLISNALKHNILNEKHVIVGWRKIPLGVQFSVSDNGQGIPEVYHKKIFQLFQTLTARDEVESTGVGLTIVKKIIDKSGGAIRVESAATGGACFSFSLPAVIVDAANNDHS